MPSLTPWNPVLLTLESSTPLEVRKTGTTDADASVRFALASVIPPT